MHDIIYFESSFGVFEITGSELGIKSLKLIDKNKIRKNRNSNLSILTDCSKQLTEYLNRKRETFDLKLDWSGSTDFNRSVWKELLKIPYGRTTSYSALADKLENPKAVRAVGLANRNNPIAIIVPCHRVIAKSGHLHGYFYGLKMKMELLQIENPESFAVQGSLFN